LSLYILMALGWFSIYLSQCRTAMFAVVLSLFTYSIINVHIVSIKIKNTLKYFRRPIAIIIFSAICILFTLNYKSIYSNITYFILKGDFKDISNVYPFELYDKSRGLIVQKSISNFKNSPVIGNGFGVGSDITRFSPNNVYFFGINIPIGASIEKSFIITALLEEVGILGTILFFVFIIFISIPIIITKNIALELMYFTAIFTTFGEMTIFSSAGIGLYIWLFIGMAMNYSVKSRNNCLLNETQ